MTFDEYFKAVIDLAASRIATRVIEYWREQITTGAVTPELQDSTIAGKTRRGSANPTYPLMDTAGLANSLYFEIEGKVLKILSDSEINPSWHGASLYEPDAMAQNNPKREVISQEKFDEFCIDEIGKAMVEVNTMERG